MARNDFPMCAQPAPKLHPQARAFLVTCEHGGYRIPAAYRHFFTNAQNIVASHRGHDVGALQLARRLATALDAPLIANTVTRLLIDLNRSLHHPQLYSEWTRKAAPPIRRDIMTRYYLRYRNQAETCIAQAISQNKQVIHLSCHSFTPVFDRVERRADIGLLYDPARIRETILCRAWQAQLAHRIPDLQVRRNYPYRGTADGFVTYLRRRFSASDYLGIELEINQRHITNAASEWRSLQKTVVTTLRQTLLLCGVEPG